MQSNESKTIKRINQQMIELSKGLGVDNVNLAKYVDALKIAGVDYNWKYTPQTDNGSVPVIRNTKENQAKIHIVEKALQTSKAKNKRQVRNEYKKKIEERTRRKATQKQISEEIAITVKVKDIYNDMDLAYEEQKQQDNNSRVQKSLQEEIREMREGLFKPSFDGKYYSDYIKYMIEQYHTGNVNFNDLQDVLQTIKEEIQIVSKGNQYTKDTYATYIRSLLKNGI